MSYLLGIDLGTSSVKCVLAAEDGVITAMAEQEYPILTPHAKWSEQAPEVWWQSAAAAVRELLAGLEISKADIKAIGLSGQMHGVIFLDRDDAVIRPAIIWADQRTTAQCQFVYQKIGYARLAQIAGSGVFPGFMLPSLLWVQEHEPRIWEAVAHVIFPKDYIRLRLTGEIATDISDASGGLLVDIHERAWSDELLDRCGLPRAILPHIFESSEVTGALTKAAAQDLGLRAGIPVVAGAADQATGALGTGMITPNILTATIGTGGQMVTLLREPRADAQLRTHTFCHALPESWYLLGATLSAGMAFRWLRDCILHEPQAGAYERMVSQAGSIPAGADGLVFLPYLVGERLAMQSTQPKGLFYGLSVRHDHGHLIRSVMEGIIFSLRRIYDVFTELGVSPETVIASGGGARSDLWRQMMADVFQTPVARLRSQEQSAVGAVILAGLGTGVYRDAAEACRAFVTYEPPVDPQPETRALYEALYEQFCTLYHNMSRLDQ